MPHGRRRPARNASETTRTTEGGPRPSFGVLESCEISTRERIGGGPLAGLRSRRRPAVTSVLGIAFVALLVLYDQGRAYDFFNVFLIGIKLGSVYALVALGYTLVYGILQLINFAHGDVFALTGLFSTTMIVSHFNLDESSGALVILGGLAATFLIAMAFGAVVNATIELVAYRRLRSAPRLAVLITAVGMSF